MVRMFVPFSLAISMFCAVACGGAKGGEHRSPDSSKLSPELREFHEVLSPAWHAKAGAERVERTCGVADGLLEKARGTKDSSLAAFAENLKKECDDPTRDEVEAWLSKVHDRFHELTER